MNVLQRSVSAVLFALTLMPAAALAQSSGIAGVVTDESGAVMPGVTVEAASPALIEGTRSATTDGSGRYAVTELRPGAYTVTFTLTGFSAIKREGIELTTSFTANVNAQMHLGSVTETIVVSGASPIVDVQNVVKQRLVDRDVVDALPTGKSWSQLGVVTVGVSSTLADVGGSAGENQNPLSAHGGSLNDKVIDMDGMRLGLLGTAGGAYASTGLSANDASTQELSFEIGASSAETTGGGVRVNVIPKDGGNTFSGLLFGNFANHAMNSDNFTGRAKFANTTVVTPDFVNQVYDTSAALGGPIVKDRLWFFTAHRQWGAEYYRADAYYEVNPIDYLWDYRPGGLTPDADHRVYDDQQLQSHNARLTWQANANNKISGYFDIQPRCTCHWLSSSTRSAEASGIQRLKPNWQGTLTYNSVINPRMLFSSGIGTMNSRWTQLAQTDGVPIDPATGLPTTAGYAVYDLAYGLTYRSIGTPGIDQRTNYSSTRSARASLSYVTGSHTAKFGFGLVSGPLRIATFMGPASNDSTLAFLNQVPYALVRYATPTLQKTNLDADLGVFATDQWRVHRLTVNAGLRFDWLKASVPAQHFDAGTWVPARDYPAIKNVPNWKDLNPRLGVVYDVFGSGKTALKASLNRYVAEESTFTAQANNPVVTSRYASLQGWSDLNGDYQPQANELFGPQLPLPGQPGGAGAVGSSLPTTRYDPSVLTGWGKRRNNWEVSAGIQQELLPRVSADVTYYRRSQGNFISTDNLAVSNTDYQQFCVTAPSDPRLPSPGAVLCGNYDLTPAAAARLTDNVVGFNDASKQHSEVWNGADISLSARLGSSSNPTYLAGGLSTGRTAYSNCGVVDNPGLFTGTLNVIGEVTSGYCEWKTNFLTQLKFTGVHTFPWDIQASGTFQSSPGPMVRATFNATSANTTLGRPLAGYVTYPVELIEPGTQYGDRLNQLDLRFAKIFKMGGKRRLKGMFDIYNSLNANPVVTQNNTFGPLWLKPQQILVGRLLKVGAQFDF